LEYGASEGRDLEKGIVALADPQHQCGGQNGDDDEGGLDLDQPLR
jgi:hypothetical protein